MQVLNGQRKYQIRLKSTSGPIEVLLVNKDPSSASPVVLPVPPPDDVLQNLPAPTPTSQVPTATTQVHTDITFSLFSESEVPIIRTVILYSRTGPPCLFPLQVPKTAVAPPTKTAPITSAIQTATGKEKSFVPHGKIGCNK